MFGGSSAGGVAKIDAKISADISICPSDDEVDPEEEETDDE